MKITILILTCLAGTPQEDCTRQTAASDPRGVQGLFTKIICGRPAREERASDGGP